MASLEGKALQYLNSLVVIAVDLVPMVDLVNTKH